MSKYFLQLKKLIVCSLTLGLICTFILSPSLLAQSNAEIAGRVFDSESNVYLPGANVVLEGTYLGAASDRDGIYRIMNVPAGTYTLKVLYVGYEEFSAQVTVASDGKRVIQDIALKLGYVRGDEVIVEGERQGQVKALNIQKSADNIKNVVAEEQLQRFPDLNTAEVVQRIPAVAVERDQGEGRYILIRGTEPRLSTTTVNGEKVATPEDEGRFVGLDVISANQLASVEVTKAITPDMDGDAIGGAVNLVTKSAFDYDKQVLNLAVGGGYSDLRGRAIYQTDLTYANRFGAEKKLGFTISGSLYKFNRGSDTNEMEWGDVETVDGDELPWALQTLDLRDYWQIDRTRYGLSGALEYRPSQGNQYFINGMFNYRTDYEWRNRLTITPDDGEWNSATSISGASVERGLRNRTENQTIYSITGGGENHFSKLGIDYRLTYTYGKEEKPDELIYTFAMDEDADLTLDLTDTDIPQYTITNLSEGYQHNPENFVLDEVESSKQKTTDENIIATLNLKYPFMLGQNRGELKFGGKASMKDKMDKNDVIFYGWEGEDDVTLAPYVADEYNDNYMNGDYEIGLLPDGDKLNDFFDANKDGDLEGEYSHEDSDPGTYNATENIYAGYAMGTLNVGKATVLAGLRIESTQIDYTGNEVVYDADGDYQATNKIESDDSYSHILPNLQLRYSLTPQANLRAAYTGTLARPNFIDLVPYRLIFQEDEEMALGNPALKPTTSNNFDLLGEYYLQGIGIVSGGIFYKSLKDIIYVSVYEQAGGDYDGYEVEQPVNGGKATLFGVEVNWQQQFTFLPGFWNGFGIYANYTYTDSKADLVGRDDTVLPGQSGDVANFALSYEKYGFQGRLSTAYFGKYIFEVGENADNDVYYDNNFRIDFSASQRITRYLQVYLQFINLNNTPLRYYIGDTNRPIQREFYSWWMQGGVKLNL
jgi:TonB-dependent receptor